ncbi:DUF4139 domain-containing protein [Aureimonas fodinaquatilis]|uniref:DUF4139 domain-containing protein n=1 Tax=Aureimonas fodinaquatilis TaxID=2565783 RepID=A0A5B0DYR1_9HYPH|nr:DUF4139 domain-containing protein [Aureimonas fodinaquatilis]KAA0971967.1 DUF4139 domain-containing protein [Aureimonas fodinaquatilis]
MSTHKAKTLPALNRAIMSACLLIALPGGLAFAQTDTQDRIEAVTMSLGGLAEIHRSVRVDGTAGFEFDVPLDQVDDILKSLIVRDPAGGVASMSLDGLSPVDETFRRLPFTPDDMHSLPRLLATLQGISIRAASGGRTVEGTVLGVEPAQQSGDGTTERDPALSVMTEDGQIAVLRLRADTELRILDEAVRDKLREAASVSGRGRTDDLRTVAVSLDGESQRDVRLDYVVPAPVWKTAYRLLLGPEKTARLQAWAVVENATGEDWRDVSLTLSSGAPVTLAQRLHQRYWHERPQLPIMAQTAAPPRPDSFKGIAAESSQDMAERANRQRADAPQMAPAPSIAAEPSAPVSQAAAAEGEAAAIYRLPDPIDLAAGRTLSVPFIDAELEAERISLFQPESGSVHPISALRLENGTGTTLPPGIVTVYAANDEGYAGDAELRGLPTGESRMISFATDRKVQVTTDAGRDEAVFRATLSEGVLRATRITRSEITYTIVGAQDAPRTVIIEHPRRSGWAFTSASLVESTPTHHRLRVELEEGATAQITAANERTETDSIELIDADTETLLYWSGQIDDAQTIKTLSDLAERRGEIARAEQQVELIGQDLDLASRNQMRIRENLAAVPGDSALGQRYVAMLEDEENSIAELGERRQKAEAKLLELRQEFATFIKAL